MERKKSGKSNILSFVPVAVLGFAALTILVAATMLFNVKWQTMRIRLNEAKRQEAEVTADQFGQGSDTLTYDSKKYCETLDMTYFNAYVKELREDRNRDIAMELRLPSLRHYSLRVLRGCSTIYWGSFPIWMTNGVSRKCSVAKT